MASFAIDSRCSSIRMIGGLTTKALPALAACETRRIAVHRACVSGNSFGVLFRVTTAGESHGPGNVVIVDGCPPGLPLELSDLRRDLARRRPGQSKIVTQRDEADEPEILSGLF